MVNYEKGGIHMGREFELKFRAQPAQQALIRQRFGEFDTIEMETTAETCEEINCTVKSHELHCHHHHH